MCVYLLQSHFEALVTRPNESCFLWACLTWRCMPGGLDLICFGVCGICFGVCGICFESQDSQTLAFKGMQLWTLDLKRSYTFLFLPVLCVLMECGWSLGEGVKFHFSRGLKIGTGTIEYVSSAHIFGTLECTCSWTGGARYIFRPIRVFLFPLPLPFPFHHSWFYK